MKNNGHIEFPDWIGRFVNRLCGDDWEEGVQGDLQENFKERTSRLGQRKAKLWLYLELTGLLRFIFYRKKRSYKNSNIMFWNHLKITLRSFRRNKAYTLLNILGLTSGLVVFILITLYVNYEYSYDHYHENKDRMYRIYQNLPGARWSHVGNLDMAPTPAPLASALMADLPEVAYASGIGKLSGRLIKVNDQTFREPTAYYTTPETFNIFSFEVIEGSISNFLTEKHTVVLSASMALKYFGKTDVLGEVIYYQNEHPVQVVGVIKDMPSNSHFTMDIIFEYETIMGIEGRSQTDWRRPGSYTYVMLKPHVDPQSFQNKLLTLRTKYRNDPIDDDREQITYHIQPLTEVYFAQGIGFEIAPTGDPQRLYIYLGIAFMILIIAGINYVNLATARAIKRTQEIGIRKVVGAQSKNLIFQFLTESFLLVFISLLISLLCVLLVLPGFSQFVDRELALDFANPALWLFLGGLCLGLSLLSGIYPAFVLTSFKLVAALKGKAQHTKGTVLRNILVVFQFTVSMALILGTIVISKQLNYIQTMNVGYNREQIVILDVRDENVKKQLAVFNEELRKIPGVVNVALSSALPGRMYRKGFVRFSDMEREDGVEQWFGHVGFDFMDLYGLELIEGRNFSRQIESDKRAYLLNESAVKALGSEDPIGKQLITWVGTGKVIGVLKDFHQSSLHEKIQPLLFSLDESGNTPSPIGFNSIKIAGDQLKTTLEAIEIKYNNLAPEYPFEYQYFDDIFDRAYLTEMKTAKLVNWFAGLTILVACLGLYGLAAYKVEQRIKEVGIRKVLGASVSRILTLLSKDFLKLLLIAFLVATPIAYYLMGYWLNNFAYHVSMGALTFLLTLAVMILIAGLAVGHRTYKAALRNPVESLRDE